MTDPLPIPPEDAVVQLARFLAQASGGNFDQLGVKHRWPVLAAARGQLALAWPAMLATLSGFTVSWRPCRPPNQEPPERYGADDAQLILLHRCGWTVDLHEPAYLGNIIAGPVAEHRNNGCTP